MTMHGQNEIERVRYWQGQRLRSRDFRDQAVFEAMLRWWHNRALHNAYGVRYGLEVALEEDDAVEVSCGLAYDCFGRELILQATRRVPLPAFAGEPPGRARLLARYKESSEFLSRSETAAGCAPLTEMPVFSWKTSERIEAEDGVPIARLTYEATAELESLPEGVEFPDELAGRARYDGEKKLLVFKGEMSSDERQKLLNLSSDAAYQQAVNELFEESQHLPALDDTFAAPRARALARPRIGSGNTPPGHTAWELWSERISNLGRNMVNKAVGVQVMIDTSAAGFTETPCYFAWLQGSLWDRPYIEFFPVPLAHIDDQSATTKQFRFRLWMPAIISILGSRVRLANQGFATEFLSFAQAKKLHVCWLGIQHAAEIGCEPVQECQCRTVNEE